MTGEEQALLRLQMTRGLGRVGLIRLVETFGSGRAALAALAADIASWSRVPGLRPDLAGRTPADDDPRLQQILATLDRLAVRLVTLWDRESYPSLLRTIYDPPALLYVRGRLPDGPTLAVVGARQASVAGNRLAGELCRELAARGVTIVSGLARGIDTAAHRGALAGDGVTVGVLGCGIDLVYPLENENLFARVLERGAILSEYPPGTPPLAGHFPGRNRIISGLSQGVLVVEAAEGSGSLITVDFALEQGREVFAVPGPVHAATSGGVNRLLKEGAHLVTEAEDIATVLWPGQPPARVRAATDELLAGLDPQARKVFLALGETPQHVDELSGKSGLTPMELSTILLDLELQGAAEQLPGMRYVRGSRG